MGLKKKRKGGRPRKVGVVRTTTGRINCKRQVMQTERQIMETALKARMRVHGVSAAAARDSRAGTVIGRMAMQGIITSEQSDAAQMYLDTCNAYQRAICAKPDYIEPKLEESGEGDHDEWCKTAIIRYNSMMNMLADYMIELRSPLIKAALEVIVVRDFHAEYLEKALSMVLDKLHDHFVARWPKERVA